MSDPGDILDHEPMSVEFFSGWIRDQHHDDSETDLDLPAYIENHWQEAIDLLPEEVWAEVSKAMWHVYDPDHVMHHHHPLEEEE